jgi:hypothetical protein
MNTKPFAPTMETTTTHQAGQRWLLRLRRLGIVLSHAEMWIPTKRTYWAWEPHRDWFVYWIWPKPTPKRIRDGGTFLMFARRDPRVRKITK